MAILSKPAGRASALALVSAGATLAISCSLGVRLGIIEPWEEGLAFSHALHFGEEGLDCSACHATFDTEEHAGMPTLSQCMLCHEDIDAEKDPERRIDVLFEGETYVARNVSALSDELIFSHPDHALDEELCGTCHTGIEESERLDQSVAVAMDDCMTCHETLGISNECATCHTVIRDDVPPPSHAGAWARVHGHTALFGAGGDVGTANRCSMCHGEEDCATCHASTPPENHTNHWRRRGHGITARMDRQNCATCHRTDTCQACHMESEPLNHTAQWGDPTNTHCLYCHISSSEEGCFVCHEGTPSHAFATPQPADHVPGMNCLQCHGLSAPLPHVHKGEECTACHL